MRRSLIATLDNPARISFDLAKTALALPSRRIDVRAAGVDSILAAEANGRTRLVLNLDKLQPYTTRVQGNNVIIMVGSGTQQSVAAGSAAKPLSNWPMCPTPRPRCFLPA